MKGGLEHHPHFQKLLSYLRSRWDFLLLLSQEGVVTVVSRA